MKNFIFIPLLAILALGIFLAYLSVLVFSQTNIPLWLGYALAAEAVAVLYIFIKNFAFELRIRDWRPAGRRKAAEPKKNNGWQFTYEEEVPDCAGANFCGILTDGDNYLFWHAFKIEPKDKLETCIVYDSLYMNESSEVARYPWTARNDEMALAALDLLTEDEREHFCARNYGRKGNVLQAIQYDEGD